MVTLQYNPFTPEVHANPYPVYHRLRTEDPVHWSGLLEAWILTRYEDVVFVLTDSRFSADRRQARNRFAEMAQQSKSAGTVVHPEDQLEVRHADGGKRDLRTEIKQKPGVSITSDFFPSLRTDRICR